MDENTQLTVTGVSNFKSSHLPRRLSQTNKVGNIMIRLIYTQTEIKDTFNRFEVDTVLDPSYINVPSWCIDEIHSRGFTEQQWEDDGIGMFILSNFNVKINGTVQHGRLGTLRMSNASIVYMK